MLTASAPMICMFCRIVALFQCRPWPGFEQYRSIECYSWYPFCNVNWTWDAAWVLWRTILKGFLVFNDALKLSGSYLLITLGRKIYRTFRIEPFFHRIFFFSFDEISVIHVRNYWRVWGVKYLQRSEKYLFLNLFLPRKENFVFVKKNFLRFCFQDTQNDVKRPEKWFGSVCGCVYVKTSENSSLCISGITRPIELKFGVHLKQM